MLLSLLLLLSSLILIFITAGLLMKRIWSRKLFYAIFPIQYLLLLFFIDHIYNDWVQSFYWNLLVPPFYLFVIWLLNRPSIKEEFMEKSYNPRVQMDAGYRPRH